MLHVILVLLVLLYINVIGEYFVSSLGSEALQIKINTNVTATIGDTNVELWFQIFSLQDSIPVTFWWITFSYLKVFLTCFISSFHLYIRNVIPDIFDIRTPQFYNSLERRKYVAVLFS
jgi:hypothetical protein